MSKAYVNNRLHLAIQHKILSLIGEEDVVLEHRVKGHIADIYWPSQNIVFEVQCSPISLKEATRRTRDFERLGIQIIWILHQKTYNKSHMTPAEQYLIKYKNVLYSNISQAKEGIIFCQEEVIFFDTRLVKSAPIEVHLDRPQKRLPFRKPLFVGDVRLLPLFRRMRQSPEIWKKKTQVWWSNFNRKVAYAKAAFKWKISLV